MIELEPLLSEITNLTPTVIGIVLFAYQAAAFAGWAPPLRSRF